MNLIGGRDPESIWYRGRKKVSRVYFTLVKLPLMLLAIMAGFVIEFMLELPFIFLILLGYRSDGKRGTVSSPDR